MGVKLESELFNLVPVLQNFHTKKTTALLCAAEEKHFLCMVNANDDIYLRCTQRTGEQISKILFWFRINKQVIQDVSFDPTGTWLLVLCLNNTIHMLPVLYVLEKIQVPETNYNTKAITSWSLPLSCICAESKNDNLQSETTTRTQSLNETNDDIVGGRQSYSCSMLSPDAIAEDVANSNNVQVEHDIDTETDIKCREAKSDLIGSSAMKNITNTIFPTALVWWRTMMHNDRVIVGYSDGTLNVLDLHNNCTLISETHINGETIKDLIICRDMKADIISLMVNSTKTQYKLLLEHRGIHYMFPGDAIPTSTVQTTVSDVNKFDDAASQIQTSDDEWTIISPGTIPTAELSQSTGIFPTARARLSSLRNLGAKKIGALKLKLTENKFFAEKYKDKFVTPSVPDKIPQPLTVPDGPYFIIQTLDDSNLLSALYSTSNLLSVHSMNGHLVPLYRYNLPELCTDAVLGHNFIYGIRKDRDVKTRDLVSSTESDEDVLHIYSSSLATIVENTDDTGIRHNPMLADISFGDEKLIDIYVVPSVATPIVSASRDIIHSQSDVGDVKRTPTEPTAKSDLVGDYIRKDNHMERIIECFDENDNKVMENDFPSVNWDNCYVITDKNFYIIELMSPIYIVFLKAVQEKNWSQTEKICQIFNLRHTDCLEFAGDIFLKKGKVYLALNIYNVARVPPMKTALKLAMFGQNNALMQLCSIALQNTYMLGQNYPLDMNLKTIIKTNGYNHLATEDLLETQHNTADSEEMNVGHLCSGFEYGKHEIDPFSDSQLSNSAKFHLSNLLLLTLIERSVCDKKLTALWNFIASNKRYHTNMASIVLSQSGLYSSAIVMALTRGSFLDSFCGLVGALVPEFGWYTELNDILLILSDKAFRECLLYLFRESYDYFNVIQKKLHQLDDKILDRLRDQLDPFNPIFRPVISQYSTSNIETGSKLIDSEYQEFARVLTETYLMVVMEIYSRKIGIDNYINAFTNITLNYDQDQFAISMKNKSSIAAGFSHSGCVLHGKAYIWGSNGIYPILNNRPIDPNDNDGVPKCVEFLSYLGLEVVSVKCGRLHTVFITNNGVYVVGSNNLGQLGLGSHITKCLHPMLISDFDGKNITLFEVGQYHCAAVVDRKLYTWGWGAHGQLGHTNIENLYRPQIVKFFIGKRIENISLGHAHSIVLCSENSLGSLKQAVYVFGSNHYGQLGQYGDNHVSKSAVPIKLVFDNNIKLIKTKFFSNLAVTEDNILYTWGLSPQMVRLQNQARKRAHAQRMQDRRSAMNLAKAQEKVEFVVDYEASTENVLENTDNNQAAKSKQTEDEAEQLSANEEVIVRVDNIIYNQQSRGDGVEVPEPVTVEEKPLEENKDYIIPTIVDTTDISEQITQISCGLFHYALLTASGYVYTWGKNFEKQLGRENISDQDSQLGVPGVVNNLTSVVQLECGSDYTLTMLNDNTIKAFGNNNNGQCGQDTIFRGSAHNGKLLKMRTAKTKKLLRLPENRQHIETPSKIRLPYDEIVFEGLNATRYLKSIPPFSSTYIRRGSILEELCRIEGKFDGLSIKSDDQYNSGEGENVTPKEPEVQMVTPVDTETSEYIHYCLFVFHGLYRMEPLLDMDNMSNEFKIRMHILNFNFTEAFKYCLSSDCDASKAITIFEYFTKDSSIIPLYREDLTQLMYELFCYFLMKSYDIGLIENYLMGDLDYYLLACAYVLYFNNNNSDIEREVLNKYASSFGRVSESSGALVRVSTTSTIPVVTQDTEQCENIFAAVTTKFKSTVCQRLLEYDDKFK